MNTTARAWLELRVARRWTEAAQTVAFELVHADGGELPGFEAGAYVDVLTPRGHLRPYSLCNSPSDRKRYLIVVLKETDGRGGSRSLHDDVREGDRLRVRGPFNEFAPNPAAVHSVLIGGGVGIAPLVSIAHCLWERGAPFELHYFARNVHRAPLAAHLMSSPFSVRVKCSWTESAGRPDFRALVGKAPHGADVYVCGPPTFSDAVTDAYVQQRRSPWRLHTEAFKTPRSPHASPSHRMT